MFTKFLRKEPPIFYDFKMLFSEELLTAFSLGQNGPRPPFMSDAPILFLYSFVWSHILKVIM